MASMTIIKTPQQALEYFRSTEALVSRFGIHPKTADLLTDTTNDKLPVRWSKIFTNAYLSDEDDRLKIERKQLREERKQQKAERETKINKEERTTGVYIISEENEKLLLRLGDGNRSKGARVAVKLYLEMDGNNDS